MSRVSRGKERGECAVSRIKKILVAKFFQYFVGAGGSSGKRIVAAAQVKQNKKKMAQAVPAWSPCVWLLLGLVDLHVAAVVPCYREACHTLRTTPPPYLVTPHSESCKRVSLTKVNVECCPRNWKQHLASLKKQCVNEKFSECTPTTLPSKSCNITEAIDDAYKKTRSVGIVWMFFCVPRHSLPYTTSRVTWFARLRLLAASERSPWRVPHILPVAPPVPFFPRYPLIYERLNDTHTPSSFKYREIFIFFSWCSKGTLMQGVKAAVEKEKKMLRQHTNFLSFHFPYTYLWHIHIYIYINIHMRYKYTERYTCLAFLT